MSNYGGNGGYGGQNQYGSYANSNPYAAQSNSNPYATQSNPYSVDSNPYANNAPANGAAPYGRRNENNSYGGAQGAYGANGGQGSYGGNNYNRPVAAPAQAYTQSAVNPASRNPQHNPFASSQDMEMGQLSRPGTQPTPAAAQNNPQFILNECKQISDGTDSITRLITQLESAHRRALASTTTDRTNPVIREIDATNADIMSQYKGLISRLKFIKSRPDAGSPTNQAQVGRVDRQLKTTYQRYMSVENDFQKKMREQVERQYRITNPDATDEEVRRVAEEGNTQIFQQALQRSDRRGESKAILSNVRDRHEAIQKIERQMEELAQLFIDMDRMVVEQEPMIQQVEQKTYETQEHVEQGNVHLDAGIKSARAARKKKWICFGISILILIVAIIVVLVVLHLVGLY